MRPRDLGSRGVFHQVVDRHAAHAAQPRLEVLNPDVHVGAETGFGDLPVGDGEQIARRHVDVVASDRELVGSGQRSECPTGDRHETRMCDPGAIVTGMHLPYLVLPDFVERLGVCRGVALDRDLRSHAAHRVDAAAVAGPDQQVDIGLEEVAIHRHARAVG